MEVLDFVKKLTSDLTEIDEGRFAHRAFLAGGAPRDIDHNKNPKDYDVFVLANGLDEEERFLDEFEEEYSYGPEDNVGPYRNLRNAMVSAVHNFKGDEGTKNIQVVFYRPEAIYDLPIMNFGTVVSAFDLNICKIGVHNQDGKFKLLKTKAYTENKDKKIITNTQEYTDIEDVVLRRRVASRAKGQAEKLGYGADIKFTKGNENLIIEAHQAPRIDTIWRNSVLDENYYACLQRYVGLRQRGNLRLNQNQVNDVYNGLLRAG